MAKEFSGQPGLFSAHTGLSILRVALFAVFAAGGFALYAATQFRGLRTAEAMEQAHLARRLAEGRGFTTRCLRPLDFWFMARNGRAVPPPHSFPDLRHAPAGPALLAAAFRAARPSFETAMRAGTFGPERQVIVPLNILLCLGAAACVCLLGLALFESRVAITATVVFVLTESILQVPLGGPARPLGLLLTTAAFAAVAWAVRWRDRGRRAWLWIWPLGAAGVLCGLGVLTGYRLAALLPAVAAWPLARFSRGRWACAAAVIALCAAVAAPWLLRNRTICGSPFGLAPYAALHETWLHPGDTLDRTDAPALTSARVESAVRTKIKANLRALVSVDLRLLGGGLAAALFLASLFHRFEEIDANGFRWCALLGLGLLLLTTAAAGRAGAEWLVVFVPVITVYGVAFFFSVTERLALFEREWAAVATGALILLSALPAALTVTGTQATIPYPPYFPPLTAYAASLTDESEAIGTDLPWATAWYGNRVSVLLPPSPAATIALHTHRLALAVLYLTTETSDLPYASGLLCGPQAGWLPVLNYEIPADFPWPFAVSLPPETRDQLILADRIRWAAAPAGTTATGAVPAP